MAKKNMFVDRRVMACAISIVIAFVGFLSLKSLPVEQYPDIAPPTVFVRTSYTGADANSVMNSVTVPLEESINGVENMDYMTSSAWSNGEVEIKVFFKQGTDPDMAVVNVQNRVSSAMGLLPAEITKVGVTVQKSQNSMLQLAALVSRDGKFDQDFLANYIDINVKPRLLRIQGIGQVTNLGNTYSLRIWMKPDVMARYGLEPTDVFAAIGAQNLVAPAGSLGEQSENTYQYTMEYKGRLTTIDEFENIIIRANTIGNALYLKDVADVELGALSYSYMSSVDKEPGVVFIINQAAGANATYVNSQINDLYEELSVHLPPGVEFTILRTSDDFLYAAMHSVIETLIIAIILVILVVYFFLQDFKATLIPSISICVSLLGTFAVVRIAGFSLNILTLFALVLAIGTVVDDAIVVVEAVMSKLESGYKSPRKATLDAMSEVSTAVISCTLVFMAVFIPVTFMPGTSGAFFKQFGVTIASSVGLSCVCAMTLCPALCAVLMKPKAKSDDDVRNLSYYTKNAYQTAYNAIFNKYSKAVPKFIKRPKLAWGLLIAACVLMSFFMKVLPKGLVPQEDQGVFFINVMAPDGSTLHETELLLDKIETKIDKLPEVESYSTVAGFGLISGVGSSNGMIVVRLNHWDDRKGLQHCIDLVMAKIYYDCEDIKNVSIIPFQMTQIPGYGDSSGVELVLQDYNNGDISELHNYANILLARLQERPEIEMATTTFSEGFPKYKVDINSVQCDKSGITPESVLSVLGAYCGGAYIGNYNQYGKIYRVMASASPEYRLDPSSLSNIYLRVNGQMAPISQFVTLTPVAGASILNRFNLFQSITCTVSPKSGYSDSDAMNAIKEIADECLPEGYGYEYGGISRELAANIDSNMTSIIYLVCVILIYLILGCLYESWFIPLAVILSVPFGLMGSFMFSKLCGMQNNIYLQTGVIMLMGLLAKTAILITEFAVDKHKQGMDIVEAAIGACHDRLRPILMTVFTMIVGMIPLIVEGGAGARGNRSLAIGVTGGMIVGTLALMFVVPAFYIVFQKLHDKFQGSEIINEEE